ncbi:DUF3592 domain-containing protein [Kitasatospora sp. NPDC101157]|uniref:DUF3592 domain-containing protein n=1 Tax=Kitasatospora sp. NPDC101157 TaxID=3364098 RepID=UPI003812D69B
MGRPRERFWAAGVVLAVLGMCLIGTIVHLERQDREFRSRAVPAKATIVRVEQAPDHRSNHTRYLLSFGPGSRLADEWTTGASVSGDVGTTLDVVYDPSEPTHLETASEGTFGRWPLRILLGALGAAALVGAAAALHGGPRHES